VLQCVTSTGVRWRNATLEVMVIWGRERRSVCKEGGAYICLYSSIGAACVTTAATAALVYSVLYASTSTYLCRAELGG
jgi:hypothetical protein